MSCDKDFFIQQEFVIENTWLKLAENFPNIDYLIYRGGDSFNFDEERHLLQLCCEDDIDNTFKKTYLALNFVSSNFEYDYIFRTNTSTFVNVDLLNSFIQTIDTENIIWTSELYSLKESPCPYPYMIYGRGNGIILSKNIIKRILHNGLNILYLKAHDDWGIGLVLNSEYMSNNLNYLDFIKSYTHGWYKSVNVQYDNGHSLCTYSNMNNSFDFLKKFITIQIKNYEDRYKENESHYELYRIFSNNMDENIDDSVNFIYEYSKNPNVFIGANHRYLTLENWKRYH